jgi:hypothetical protein
MEKIPYLLVKDFFTSEELESIWEELTFLNNPAIMLPPEKTAAAMDPEGRPLKNNSGLFLKDFYVNPLSSPLIRFSQKVFSGYTREFSTLHPTNRNILSTRRSTYLLSYYEDSDYYAPHSDHAETTALFWLFREPKRFQGGDLKFDDTCEVIPVENNCMIMFPSWALHSVSEVKMDEEHRSKKLGRYCFTQFLQLN